LEGLAIIKDGGIIAAVKIGIGFDKEVIGEKAAAIAEQNAEEVGGLGAVAVPGLKPEIEFGSQAEAKHQEGHKPQAGYSS
jgi:hypothetical protein